MNSVTVTKNVKGDPLGFFEIPCVAKYRNKQRGDPLVESQKLQNSRIVPKTIRVKTPKGASYVFEVLYVDGFVLDEVLAFRVCFGGP